MCGSNFYESDVTSFCDFTSEISKKTKKKAYLVDKLLNWKLQRSSLRSICRISIRKSNQGFFSNAKFDDYS